jgi:hypothetical protein
MPIINVKVSGQKSAAMTAAIPVSCSTTRAGSCARSRSYGHHH